MTLDKIVLLQKNLPEPALSTGIVLQVEFVKTMERVFVRMHIKQIDIEVIPVMSRTPCKKLSIASFQGMEAEAQVGKGHKRLEFTRSNRGSQTPLLESSTFHHEKSPPKRKNPSLSSTALTSLTKVATIFNRRNPELRIE